MIRATKPMIDLLMLLLLLFSSQHIATMRQAQDISVSQYIQTESEETGITADQFRYIALHLSAGAVLLLDGEEISLADLIKKTRAERVVTVYIYINDSTPYAELRKVISKLADEGLSIKLG